GQGRLATRHSRTGWRGSPGSAAARWARGSTPVPRRSRRATPRGRASPAAPAGRRPPASSHAVARAGRAGPPAWAASRRAAASGHGRRLIEQAGPACVAVKPQLACFERLGAPGWRALAEVCEAARRAGLLVVADGKRGDVPVTARAYGEALVGETQTPWGPVPGLGVDAFTANPLLGEDAIDALIDAAAPAGAGIFLLVRTSNPGAARLQD